MLKFYKNINGYFQQAQYQAFEQSIAYPLIGDTRFLIPFQIPCVNAVCDAFQLRKILTVSSLNFGSEPVILETIDLNINYLQAINNKYLRFQETEISEIVTPGNYQFYISLDNGTSYISDIFSIISIEIPDITKFLGDNNSPIKFFELGREISTQQANEAFLVDAYKVNYSYLAPFKLTYKNDSQLIDSFQLLKLQHNNGLISLDSNGFFIVSEIIDLDSFSLEIIGNEIVYSAISQLSEYFVDPGLYQIYIKDVTGNEFISEIISPVYPDCKLLDKTMPDPAIAANIVGETLEIQYSVPNAYTYVQFQVLIEGKWYNLGDKIKAFATENNEVTLDYYPEFEQIRYINTLPGCSIGITRAYDFGGVIVTYRILQANGGRIRTNTGKFLRKTQTT